MAGRLVQQDRGRLHRFQARGRIHFDVFIGYPVLRCFHHLAVHRHPAVADVLLGVGARATGQFGDATGKADRIGHG